MHLLLYSAILEAVPPNTITVDKSMGFEVIDICIRILNSVIYEVANFGFVS